MLNLSDDLLGTCSLTHRILLRLGRKCLLDQSPDLVQIQLNPNTAREALTHMEIIQIKKCTRTFAGSVHRRTPS